MKTKKEILKKFPEEILFQGQKRNVCPDCKCKDYPNCTSIHNDDDEEETGYRMPCTTCMDNETLEHKYINTQGVAEHPRDEESIIPEHYFGPMLDDKLNHLRGEDGKLLYEHYRCRDCKCQLFPDCGTYDAQQNYTPCPKCREPVTEEHLQIGKDGLGRTDSKGRWIVDKYIYPTDWESPSAPTWNKPAKNQEEAKLKEAMTKKVIIPEPEEPKASMKRKLIIPEEDDREAKKQRLQMLLQQLIKAFAEL